MLTIVRWKLVTAEGLLLVQISEPGKWPFPTAVSWLIQCFEAGQDVTGALEMLLARPDLETELIQQQEKAVLRGQ